jgi:ADP-ribose pyrophosphatase YjhB (NUDIX family)
MVNMKRSALTGMMRTTLASAAILLLLRGTVGAEAPAGMVPYFHAGGEVYLLLAEHAGSGRGWAGFGGGAMEGETVVQTAARKAHEESRGFYKQADLLKMSKGVEPVMDGDFASYFVEVPFVPAPSVTNHPVPEENDAYLERSTFAWIPYSAVAPRLSQDIDGKKKYMIDPAFLPVGSQTQWFWPIWLGNMHKAAATKSLPWQK